MGVELVFFYGPPYAGKTLFYFKHFQATHQRVCPSAIFDSDPDITLRSLILKIVVILKKGQSVVLDDENEFRHTRTSYINLIKAKVPDCRFLCIEFQVSPSVGHFQSNWAREWNIAQLFLDERKISEFNPLEKERKLCQWFEEEKIDPPCDTEGFEVSRVQTGLSCDCPFKFEVPALLMQMEVLSPKKLNDGTSNIENLATFINTWTSVNTTGRVIFLGNLQHSCHQAGEATGIGEEPSNDECCSCLGHAKEKLRQLALKIDTPLYFALADYSLLQYPFILPPQPGLLAWIQRLHTIDITHKSSLYVCMTEAHTKMAQCAGLRTLKTKTLMNNPKIVTNSYRTRQSAAPVCVSESKVSYYRHISLSSDVELESESSGCDIRPSPHIPLLDKARTSCTQMEQPCIVTEFAVGRYHGVCFKNLEILEKYQELYKTSASPTDEVFCSPYKLDCIKPSVSSEPTNQQNIASSSTTLHKDEQVVNGDTSNKSELKRTKSDSKTVVSSQSGSEHLQSPTSHCIKLEREDIEGVALSESRYKKGKEIQHLIKGLNATLDKDKAEELLRISCTCKGSTGQNYDVFAIIGSHGIKQAKCSCLDSASQTGQCKHVVAMLLNYIDKDQLNNNQENCSHSISNPVSQPAEKNEDGKHSKSFKRKRKSSQRVAGWQNTVYVMSSRELLETANQILQEHNQRHKDRTEDGEEAQVVSHETKIPRDILSTESSPELSKEEETAENANDSSSPKQQESFLEDKLAKKLDKPSPRSHFTENSNQMNKEEKSLYEETKRQRTSYGKSILEEMI